MISLLDTADHNIIDVWLVFRDADRTCSRLWRLLKPGFQHVEVWQRDRGAWARCNACFENTVLQVYLDPPWAYFENATYLQVRRLVRRRKLRDWFTLGPHTCVDGVKAVLGVRWFWVRTPYQLYQRLRSEG